MCILIKSRKLRTMYEIIIIIIIITNNNSNNKQFVPDLETVPSRNDSHRVWKKSQNFNVTNLSIRSLHRQMSRSLRWTHFINKVRIIVVLVVLVVVDFVDFVVVPKFHQLFSYPLLIHLLQISLKSAHNKQTDNHGSKVKTLPPPSAAEPRDQRRSADQYSVRDGVKVIDLGPQIISDRSQHWAHFLTRNEPKCRTLTNNFQCCYPGHP